MVAIDYQRNETTVDDYPENQSQNKSQNKSQNNSQTDYSNRFSIHFLNCRPTIAAIIRGEFAGIFGVFALLIALVFSPGVCALESRLSAESVAIDNTVQLVITTFNNGDLNQLDLKSLEKDFDVVGFSQQVSLSGTGARGQSLLIDLKPKRIGNIRIASFRLQNKASKPLILRVTPPAPIPDSLYDGAVWIEASVSRQDIFVGQPFVYSIKVFSPVALKSDAARWEIESATKEIMMVGRNEKRVLNTVVKGKRYDYHEWRYLVKPTEAGPLTLAGPTVRAAPDTFFNSGEYFKLKPKPLTIIAKPLPADVPGSILLAEHLTIEDQPIAEAEFTVGQPITRRIAITAKGLKAESLPDLQMQGSNEFQVYEEPSRYHNEEWIGGYAGTRTETFAVIPRQPGTITLPAISIDWWNTETTQLENTTLPAVTFNVAPSTMQGLSEQETAKKNTRSTPTPSNRDLTALDQTSEPPLMALNETRRQLRQWQFSSALLALISLSLVIAMIVMQRRLSSLISPADEYVDLQQVQARRLDLTRSELIDACKQNDAKRAKRLLNQYQKLKPNNVPMNGIVEEIGKLDACLFAHSESEVLAPWRGDLLADIIAKDAQSSRTSRESDAIPQLYPT